MCIIVFRPCDIPTPSKETLKRCWDKNPHGGGIMWQTSLGNLKVRKGFMTFDEMYAAIKGIPKNMNAVLHFRIGTHGENSAENTHPWPIEGQDAALVHNGIINWLSDDRSTSDSKRFADFLSRIEGSVLYNQDLVPVFESILGGHNKVVVMDGINHVILNENCGEWFEECWYSNSGYAKPKEYVGSTIFDHIADLNRRDKSQQVDLMFESGHVMSVSCKSFLANYRFYDYTARMCKKIEKLVAGWSKKK